MQRTSLSRSSLAAHTLPAYLPSVCGQTTELSKTAVTTILYFVLTKIVQPILMRAAKRLSAIRKESRNVREKRLVGLAMSSLDRVMRTISDRVQWSSPAYTLDYSYMYSDSIGYSI